MFHLNELIKLESLADIIAWHFHRAEEKERNELWSAAIFHWNELIKLKPDDQTFRERLNRARDQMNRTNAFPSP